MSQEKTEMKKRMAIPTNTDQYLLMPSNVGKRNWVSAELCTGKRKNLDKEGRLSAIGGSWWTRMNQTRKV